MQSTSQPEFADELDWLGLDEGARLGSHFAQSTLLCSSTAKHALKHPLGCVIELRPFTGQLHCNSELPSSAARPVQLRWTSTKWRWPSLVLVCMAAGVLEYLMGDALHAACPCLLSFLAHGPPALAHNACPTDRSTVPLAGGGHDPLLWEDMPGLSSDGEDDQVRCPACLPNRCDSGSAEQKKHSGLPILLPSR